MIQCHHPPALATNLHTGPLIIKAASSIDGALAPPHPSAGVPGAQLGRQSAQVSERSLLKDRNRVEKEVSIQSSGLPV